MIAGMLTASRRSIRSALPLDCHIIIYCNRNLELLVVVAVVVAAVVVVGSSVAHVRIVSY